MLANLLERNREAIVGKWFEFIIKTYPRETSQFLAKQKDRFRNPVGHAISENIGPIFDEVVSGMDKDVLRDALDGIIRIRSVQDFTPSEALAFIFELKNVIRTVLSVRDSDAEHLEQMAEIDSRIDRVAMIAFDKYTQCREQLHEIKTNEIRKRSMRLLDRVNLRPVASQPKGVSGNED